MFLTLALTLTAPASLLAGSGAAVFTTVPGTVEDLSVDSTGVLVYATAEGDVGRVQSNGSTTLLATSVSAPFPNPLRALTELPNGDLAVLDSAGEVYRLPGGLAPAQILYDDLYLVSDPTDLIADANGTLVIASKTPSSGFRAVNWISADGQHWAYYLVAHQPVALAADPLGPGLLLADAGAGGALRLVDTSQPSHPTSPLDTQSSPGFSAAAHDGDLSALAGGDAWFVAGDTLWYFDRAQGTSAPVALGFGAARGVAVAASSGNVPSASGWSVYFAAGASPTSIVELGDSPAPAGLLAGDLGEVPWKGETVLFWGDLRAYELTAHPSGDLYAGGEHWGGVVRVKRVDLASSTATTVADQTDGLASRVEGLAVTPDGSLIVAGTAGTLQHLDPGTGAVTTIFTDPLDELGSVKDMVLDFDGTHYLAHRGGYGWGGIVSVAANGAWLANLVDLVEARGLAVDPFGDASSPSPATPGLFVSEWHDTGFHGTVDRYDPAADALVPLPDFDELNYTNASGWGDGDTVADAAGHLYSFSEDDWSLHRWDRVTHEQVRVGSGYLKHPSGLAIARSRPGTVSSTGWSLYAAEFDWLYEIPDAAAPLPQRLDRNAPTAGRVAGWLPGDAGAARALCVDPSGSGLLVATSAGRVLSIDPTLGGMATEVVGAAVGLPPDLVALAPRAGAGTFYVAARDGRVFELDPLAGWTATLVFDDASNELDDVVDFAVANATQRLWLTTSAPGSNWGRLWRVDLAGAGSATPYATTAGGRGVGIDPLTGELFVAEGGRPGEGGGELLRIDATGPAPRAGHWRGAAFELFDVADPAHANLPIGSGGSGSLAFTDAGDVYLATAGGRVLRADRASGATALVLGNTDHAVDLALAPGTPGTAGTGGTSLFVLGEAVLFELGVDDQPAPPPPGSPPGLAPPADLTVVGQAAPGQLTSVAIDSPADANRFAVIAAGFAGKSPGFPIGAIGHPADPRILPNNPNVLWKFLQNPVLMPGFLATLDASGKSPPGTGFGVPNDPALLSLGVFLDLAWFSFDPASPGGIGTVGGTAQIWFGP